MNIQEIRKQYPQYQDMSDQQLAEGMRQKYYPDMPKMDFYQKIGMDWQNIGGDVVGNEPGPSVEQLAQQGRGADLLKVDLDKGVEKTWDRIGANVQAGYTGVLQLGSSLVKLADKIGVAPEGSGKAAQVAYDEAEKIYQAGEYPETAVTKFASTMAIPGLGAPIGIGAKLGSGLLGKAGQYLGAAAGGSVTGAVVGGLSNEAGMAPDDVFNESGAATGALLGAPLGAAGQFVANYGKNTAAYQTAKEALGDVGYTGPVLARDYGDEAIGALKSAWMDNLITSGVRDEQLQAITPAIKAVLGKLVDSTPQAESHKLGMTIRNINSKLEAESSQKWNDLFVAAKDAGISKIDTTSTKNAVADLIASYGDGLAKKDLSVLNLLANAKQVDLGVLNRVKGSEIWRMAEKYGSKEGSVVNENIANGLKDIYWNITDDIGNALKGKPELESAWQGARAFTQGVKSIFNYDNNRKLMNAITDINENTGQLKTFINSIMKPVSSESTKYYNKALGESYSSQVSDTALSRIFTESFNTEAKGLNLKQFFDGIKEADAGGLINNNTVQAVGGLEKFFNRIQKSKMESSSQANIATQYKSAIPYIQGGSIASGYLSAGPLGGTAMAAAILAGPKLLGWVSKNSPIKNSLAALAKVWDKNPSMVEYLTKSIGKKLTQAGVMVNPGQDSLTVERK